MPARYGIYPDAAFVHTTAYGTLRRDEMLAHARALAADPTFAPTFSQLVDFRPASALEVDGEDIRRLAAARPFDPSARRVALVGAEYVYGLLRMYEIMTDTEGASTLVTQHEADAWAFLRLSADVVRRPAASAWDSGD